jgi:YidC/Oxa1 family membrane protein insertase
MPTDSQPKMDRKGILAIVLSVAVLIAWQWFAPKTPPPPPGASASPSPAASAAAASASPATMASISAATTGTGGANAQTPSVPEKVTDVSGPAAIYEFTNHGGGISRAELKSYTTSSGSSVLLDEFGTVPIGGISDQPDSGADLPYTVTTNGNVVTCERDQPGGLSVIKTYTLPSYKPDADANKSDDHWWSFIQNIFEGQASAAEAQKYLLNVDITFTNKGAAAVRSPGYYLHAGSATPLHQRDYPTYTAFDWNAAGKATHIDVGWFNARKIPFIGYELHPEAPFYSVDGTDIRWASINNQFFTTIIVPRNDLTGNSVWAHRFNVTTDDRTVLAIDGAMKLPPFSLAAGASTTQSFQIYAGPKLYRALKGLGDGQQQILNFGIYTPISTFLLSLMNLLHQWTGSYAIAIILMTLCIRGILWPIQNRATASMRQMQAITPRMNELKEKYKDDPNRMNQEVMKLYKEYNINPLAGCWPMLIQMPIFFAFYRLLGTAIELRGSSFLWVHDLSQPDTLFHFMNYPVNILPLCMAATMLMQMSLQPKTGDQAQQRMYLIMPLIFLLFCYNFASALALYYTIGNVFSIAQLYMTRKKTAPAPVKVLPPKRRSR